MNEQRKKYIPITLIGNDYTGRTSILLRYFQNCFKQTYIKTINKDIYESSLIFDNQKIILRLYDTPGLNSRYKDISFQALKNSRGIMIVYGIDDRDSFENLKNIIQKVKSMKNVFITLVGNKAEIKERKVSYEEGKKLAEDNNIEFYECSAFTGLNIQECIEKMAFTIFTEFLDKYEKDLAKDKENEKDKDEFIMKVSKYYKKNVNIIRCEKCLRIPLIEYFDEGIRIKCKCDNKIKIYKNLQFMNCSMCKKSFDYKNFKELFLEIKEQKLICKNCIKDYKERNTTSKIINCFSGDYLCEEHEKLNNIYCEECNNFYCFKCNHEHNKLKKVDDLNGFKYYIKDLIENEEKELKKIDALYENIIKDIKNVFDEFKKKKQNEIKFHNEIYEYFDNIFYNANLYNSIKNLNFHPYKKIELDIKVSLIKKLEKVFFNIDKPLENEYLIIHKNSLDKEKTNIIEDNNNYKTPIVDKGKINIIEENKDYNTPIIDKGKINIIEEENNNNKTPIEVTGGVMLNDDLFALGLNNGFLKMFSKNDINNSINSIKLFENLQGINSMIKIRDIQYNSKIYASGFEKIKIIGFKDNFKVSEVIGEISEPETNFNKLISYNDDTNILYSTFNNQLITFNIESKTKENISKKIFGDKEFNIITFKNLGNTLFYIETKRVQDTEVLPEQPTLIESESNIKYSLEKIIFNISNNNEINNKYELNKEAIIIDHLNDDYITIGEQDGNNFNISFLKIENKEKNNIYSITNINKINLITLIKTKEIYNYFIVINDEQKILEFIYDKEMKKIIKNILVKDKFDFLFSDGVKDEVEIAKFQFEKLLILLFNSGNYIKIKFN